MKKAGTSRWKVFITCAICAFLALMCALNCRLLYAPLRGLAKGELNFSECVQQIQDAYAESLSPKNAFVNLNGLFAALLDQSSCNEVVKLNNGMLHALVPESDMTVRAEHAVELRNFLASQGIEFMHIQLPEKLDLGEELLPEGYEDCGNENADAYISVLEDGGVQVLDLRPELAATPEQVERNFLRTDHHWNNTGAFSGFQLICDYLQQRFPEEVPDLSGTDPQQWESHTQESWSIGSHGRRVGIFYGGLDDLTYYTPRFPTKISTAIPARNALRKGDFVDANMRLSVLQNRSLFGADGYNLYIGGSYPLVRCWNPEAPNKLRILITCDSFYRPLLSFMSAVFQEVDTIFHGSTDICSVAQYAQFYQPDIVIQMLFPTSLTSKSSEDYDYGVADARSTDFEARKAVLEESELRVPQCESGYASLPASLERGRSYLLHFDEIAFPSGSSLGAAVGFYDPASKAALDVALFDIERCQTSGDFSWLFTLPEGAGEQIELRFYAGLPKDAPNNAAVYRGIRLDAIG